LLCFLLKATKNRWIFDNALCPRRLAWSGALTAIFVCSVIYAAGCGAGSTTIAPPPVLTTSGSSTITVAMSAMSFSGKPLQRQQALQLTLTVKCRW